MPREHYGAPFYMIITDKENGAFSVEGPMTDDLTISGSSAEDAARNWLQRYSGKQLLPGEIVHL